MYQDLKDSYVENMLFSANPLQLIIIAYDKAIEFMELAIEAIDAGLDNVDNLIKKCEYITKATEAVAILHDSLNFEKGGQVAKDLSNFYRVILEGLLIANQKNDKELRQNMIMMLSGVKQAWEELERREYGSKSVATEKAAPSV